jgi:hypothetical protein
VEKISRQYHHVAGIILPFRIAGIGPGDIIDIIEIGPQNGADTNQINDGQDRGGFHQKTVLRKPLPEGNL